MSDNTQSVSETKTVFPQAYFLPSHPVCLISFELLESCGRAQFRLIWGRKNFLFSKN